MEGVSPTDALGYGLMAFGMVKWMGDNSKPPITLTHKQTLWIMDFLDARWASISSLGVCHEIAVAAVTHLLGWLAWLWSVELFSLTWADVTITHPGSGPTIGLPAGIGALELHLFPKTKSDQMKMADVVISYVCASGLSPGLWVERLSHLWPASSPTNHVICGHCSTPWTNHYFRQQHFYPWLYQMHSDGEPFLQAFTLDKGNHIEDKYYLFGTYCHGGWSSCQKRTNGTKKATPDEVYEHGQWRRHIAKESIQYNEYTLVDCLNITFLCM